MEPVTYFLLLAVAVLCFEFLKKVIYKTGPTNIPGPKGWPLIGNAGIFFGVDDGEKAFKAFKIMAGAHDSPLSRVWLGPKLCILVKDPKCMDVLMNHRGLIEKDPFFYNMFREATGGGVFTRSTAEGWHKLRKPLANFLLPKNLSSFQYTISLKTDEILITQLDKHLDGEPFNYSSYVKVCSLEILLMATLGVESLDNMVDDKVKFLEDVDREVENILSGMWSLWNIMKLKGYNPEGARNLEHVPYKIMAELKTLRQQLGRKVTAQPENYADVIFTIGAEENLSDQEMVRLLIDYLIAGSDTQSVVSSTTLILLAINQECQAKVVEELTSIFGDSTRDANDGDLKRMVYLEMCIKEALRFSCPPCVMRLAEEDIEIDGYVIPRGSGVVFTLFMMMKDPRYWERPEEFYPDHFLPEAVAKRPKGAFLPFAAGPRNCPGQAYSFRAMKTMVSTLLRRYHWTTDMKFNELRYKYLLMREPIKPMVKLTRRIWHY